MVARQEVTLVLGGARSGKSTVAERLVAASSLPVTYVATGAPGADDDPEWRARVEAHRARRPAGWTTREVPADGDLWDVLSAADGAALVDSIGTWVVTFEAFSCPTEKLCASLTDRAARGLPTVIVSEEVGLGVHPATEVGRQFADALGAVNQAVAAVAGTVLLVVAGRVLELPAPVEGAGR
jgi:adenosyl cobinamide kinase/adenosyl cobinamide phosphate guanylyltransferase